MYSWFSMVVLPEGHKPTVSTRYSRELEDGFIELKVATFPQSIRLINSVFPKLAALAGYRKDKQVPRGWLTYKNKTLRLCSGAATVHKSDAPKGTAFDGMCQHDPADESAILVQMDVEIDSLHHLFCQRTGLHISYPVPAVLSIFGTSDYEMRPGLRVRSPGAACRKWPVQHDWHSGNIARCLVVYARDSLSDHVHGQH